ncbi:FAD-binding oxidoreductase [Aestuariispira insulae]|uniref:FAD/FMN-containing dehydrogenase n=1 Tax=Aestuariispira insulae TaxID=1461337 RepID=A0A3D9HMM2_9PROT|nr:FAD-binding oxidoreductase [Aestuariispira insulae]RED50750.1 FAD/FMN-containing dehydrogenase [Aestuariispira insulae]
MHAERTEFLDRLEAAIGAKNLMRHDQDLSGYEKGARYGHGRALAVARPASTEEVSAVLRACFAHDVPVVPQGANTGLTGASTPDEGGQMLVLSLERLKAPIEIDPINRSVLVGAGVSLSQLNQALASHGLFFPIDLGADPTVGGMIATNTGGSRLIRYGDVRRNLLGVEVVLPDAEGTVIDDLKALRKNNLGLDLKQLFTGTGGQYGIVTRAILELHPSPKDRAVALVVPRDEAAMDEILLHLEHHAGPWLTAFESLSRATVEVVLKHRPALPNPFAQFDNPPDDCLLVEFSAADSESLGSSLEDFLAEQIMALYADDGSGAVANAVFNRPEEIWGLRHSISEAVAQEGRIIAHDISCPRSSLGEFRRRAKALLAEKYPYLKIYDFGHRGDGGEHFNLIWPHGAQPYCPEIAEEIRTDIYKIVMEGLNGSFSAEHGVGPINRHYCEKYLPAATLAAQTALKAHFDPKGLLGR